MGNRAIITTENKKLAVYVHWNGGPESICAFLTYAKAYGVRNCQQDEPYFFARLTQIIANFFGGTISIGVELFDENTPEACDNGGYVVDKNFNVLERLCADCTKKECPESFLRDFLKEINESQPTKLDNEILESVDFVSIPSLEIFKDKGYDNAK